MDATERHPIDRDDADPLGALRPAPPASVRERAWLVLDALGIGPARAAAGVVVLAAALAAGMWALRPAPAPVEASIPLATATTAATTTTAPADLVVHVAGAVRRPGVIEVPAGARVVDAIEAAGGVVEGADTGRLNLAAPVADGARIYVPVEGEPIPDAPGSGATSGDGAVGPVDLNTASLDELDALPGIGPATAQAIIDWREAHGGFASVDQLLDVRGIGDAKLAELRDLVTV